MHSVNYGEEPRQVPKGQMISRYYQDIVRTTRIFTDHRKSLKQVQMNGHRDVISTSTSRYSNQQEHTGRSTEEYGIRLIPRMV